MTNISLYIGGSADDVLANQLVASNMSWAAGQTRMVMANARGDGKRVWGRYVILYAGAGGEGTMSLARVQVWPEQANAAYEKPTFSSSSIKLNNTTDGNVATCSAVSATGDSRGEPGQAPLPPPRCAACEPHPPRAATRDPLRTGPRAGPPSPPRCDATRPCAFPFPPFPPAVQPTWRWTWATPLTWPRWS